MVLVVSDVGDASVENFTHLEYSSCSTVLRPKVFGYFWNSVDADAVEIKLRHDAADPGFEVGSDVGVVLVEIG